MGKYNYKYKCPVCGCEDIFLSYLKPNQGSDVPKYIECPCCSIIPYYNSFKGGVMHQIKAYSRNPHTKKTFIITSTYTGYFLKDDKNIQNILNNQYFNSENYKRFIR